jgi:lysozyme
MDTGMINMNIYKQLKRDEGEVLHAYKDSLGYWTIGIGILIDKEKDGGLRPEESEFIFNNRLKIIERDLRTRIVFFNKLDQVRQGVLLNMAFQVGVNGLLGFKNTLRTIEQGDYKKAAIEMLQSKWATQTPVRAKRLSEQMSTGVWQ